MSGLNQFNQTKLGQTLSLAASFLLNLVLPLSCVVCGREGRYVCDGCEAALPRLEKPFCFICASPGVPQLCQWCFETSPSVSGIRAPYLYEGHARQMVHDLKYRSVRAAAPEASRLLAAYLETHPLPADILIPVPLHSRRERARGYNQSQLLAQELGRLTGIPVETSLLRRVRHTPPQVEMETPQERKRNIQEAFQCLSDMEGRTVLLIDDVVTTGSTMSACADALRDRGSGAVLGLALARQSRASIESNPAAI